MSLLGFDHGRASAFISLIEKYITLNHWTNK